MAQKPRVVLINPSGRVLLNTLNVDYPEYVWVLTMRNGKEVCIGLRDGKPCVYGIDYDNIVDTINALHS